MDRLLGSDDAAGDLDRPVGDDLVGVHVGLGARPGLKYDQRKLVVELAVDDILSCMDDEFGLLLRQLPELEVRQRRAFFQEAERADHRPAPAVPLGADREVEPGALGLRAPQVFRRHPNFAERVFFDAKFLAFRHNGLHAWLLRGIAMRRRSGESKEAQPLLLSRLCFSIRPGFAPVPTPLEAGRALDSK